MATAIKYNNISIQPLKVAGQSTSKKTFVTIKDNLTWQEINQKSTSDKRKRRVAHVAKFAVPIIKEHIPSSEKSEKQKQKNLKQKKPKIKKPENEKFKKVQNLGNQHMKMKNLRQFITTIPWSYSDLCFGKSTSTHISEKRNSASFEDSLERTIVTAKKQKTN